MRFGLYSEIQLHPGKAPETLFVEVLEQMENADRLGFDALRRARDASLPGLPGDGCRDGLG
jgi:hypothetical protein